MMKMKTAFLFFLICFNLITGCRGESQESRANIVVSRISSELNLNDAQRAKLELVKNQWLENRTQQKAERQNDQNQMIAMIRSTQIDVPALQALIKRRQENAFSSKNIALIADFHSSLSQEQRNKLADRIQEFRNKFDRE